jgi:type II secretion system protein C
MLSLRRFDWTLYLMTIALCSYFVAQSITTYVGGILEGVPVSIHQETSAPLAPPVEDEGAGGVADEFQAIVDRNVFNSAFSPVDAAQESQSDPALNAGELGPAVKTTLDIKVLGTLVIGDGTDNRSSATISGKSSGKGGGKSGADVYFPGDEKTFEPNVKLTKVGSKQIEFVNGGRLEFAELEDFASKKSVFASRDEVFGKDGAKAGKEKPADDKQASPAEGGKVILDQSEIDEALQNMDKLYSDVRIVPNFKGGKSAGMKVLSIKPGSLASKLGIRRGDVLEKINGQDLDIKQGMELFSQMKDMKSFTVDIVRGGKNQTVEYEIK